jgi:uncharacterized repeat protein (TIGR03803 family)
MQNKKHLFTSTAMLALFTAILLAMGTRADAQQEVVLHNFNDNGKDAARPIGGLVFDKAGNLYGTSAQGGIYDAGAVFELTPKAGGGWTTKVLHSFNPNGPDGNDPLGGVIFDLYGNLYGTTYYGGANNAGTVFELIPQPTGGWVEQVLYSFTANGTDGQYPVAGLILDAVGNLYGTTFEGGNRSAGCGNFGCGTVFELAHGTGGTWAEKILYSFSGTDGGSPWGSLTLDAAGNLYGTTTGFNASNYGSVFELTPSSGGGWTETVLHTFASGGTDGQSPYAGLLLDAVGNLYGTTYGGGPHSYGTVFELKHTTGAGWLEKVLHGFGAIGDGSNPSYGALTQDSAGNLYGTTSSGGSAYFGTAFKLVPAKGGTWTETVIHNFPEFGSDGFTPLAGFIIDASGNLYGTAGYGGASGEGAVFEIRR